MSDKFKFCKCQKCPAFHLLTDERKLLVEKWEYRRDKYIDRMKKIRLILLGESMPGNRYFYDIETQYEGDGLRYSLKMEFDKLDLTDSLFLESLTRKGVALYDCALCPLHLLNDNVLRRKAATHCFLSINIKHLNDNPGVPIATIFPSRVGFLKTEIPDEIKSRVIEEYSFSNQAGLSQLYEKVKLSNQ